MSKTYRAEGSFRLDFPVRVYPDVPYSSASYPLKHHVRHSPDGHSWGYGGSGPAELAKDVLWDFLGHEPHPRLYQEFKFNVIAALPQNGGFTLTEEQIQRWLDDHPAPEWPRTPSRFS